MGARLETMDRMEKYLSVDSGVQLEQIDGHVLEPHGKVSEAVPLLLV